MDISFCQKSLPSPATFALECNLSEILQYTIPSSKPTIGTNSLTLANSYCTNITGDDQELGNHDQPPISWDL